MPVNTLRFNQEFGQQLYWQQKQQSSLPLDLLKMWMAPPQQPLSQQQTQQLVTALFQQKPLTVLPLLEMWLNNNCQHSQSAVVDELMSVFWLNNPTNDRLKELSKNVAIVCQTILSTLAVPD